MDSRYEQAQPGAQQPSLYNPYPGPERGARAAPSPAWTPPPVYDGHPYGLMSDFPAPHPGGACFVGPHFPPSFGFDPTVPPPPFGCPPPRHFPSQPPPAPVNAYGSAGGSTFPTVSQDFRVAPPRYDSDRDPDRSHRQYELYRDRGLLPSCHPPPQGRDISGPGTRPEDETALQRRRDRQWVARFLKSTVKTTVSPNTRQRQPSGTCVSSLRETLYGAAQLVSRLEELCHTLKHNQENESTWPSSYSMALHVKGELQDKMDILNDPKCLTRLKAKLSVIAQRRSRRLRARKELQMEEKLAEERRSEKEAAIDGWRLKQIQQVEEKKKEQELKLAADAVLCEVRKKQADVKRMQDVLRSLEKLRRLRKEAASRKGIVTEQQCDEEFSSRLEQLRSVIRSRTAVYSAEEKALMVMLEGEQEEERRRDRERRMKKEWEREQQRKRRVNAMLFGEELPADCALQPFRDYYSQAEHSLQALIQIRSEWDSFLVAADNPDGSSVPQTWVLPEPPSDRAWASALQAAGTDSHSL
ncbi:programmed cell death protein 7 [Xenentodon cancila]